MFVTIIFGCNTNDSKDSQNDELSNILLETLAEGAKSNLSDSLVLLRRTLFIKEKALESSKSLNLILTEARESAKLSGDKKLSKADERKFFANLAILNSLWDSTIILKTPSSDLEVLCEAMQVQTLAMTEISSLFRFFGLRDNSSLFTDMTKTSIELKLDISSLQIQTILQLTNDLTILDSEPSISIMKKYPLLNDIEYSDLEKASAKISGKILDALEKYSPSPSNSMSDLKADLLFRSYLNEHYAIRMNYHPVFNHISEFSELDYARISLGLRYANDYAAYLSMRLNDPQWINIIIRFYKLEVAYGEALVEHLKSKESRDFWLGDDGRLR